MLPDQPMIGFITQASMLKVSDSIIGNSDIAVCRASSFCLLAHTVSNSRGHLRPPLCRPEAFLESMVMRKQEERNTVSVFRSLRPYVSIAGVPGLEPRMDEPESPVLPITPYPNWLCDNRLDGCHMSYPRPDLDRCWRRERA